MGPLKELSRVQYMSYANVSEGEHHLPHTPGLPVGIVVTRHMPISPALSRWPRRRTRSTSTSSTDDLPDPELFTNGTVEGNVCWEVADDDVDSLQMFLDSGLFSGLLSDTPRTWFALQDKTSN